MRKYSEIQKTVLKYAQTLYLDKLVAGTSGNISIYDTEHNVVAITPGSEDYMKMTWERIVIIDLQGNVIEGSGKPSSEWRMHTEIYKRRSDIKAVVHTHSPYATGFAVLHEDIPVILLEMIPWIKGDIRVSELALPGTVEVGTVALEVLRERYACLLRNHGVIAVGETIQKAYTRAAYVEDAAKIFYISKTAGTPHMIPEEMIRMMQVKLTPPLEKDVNLA